MDISQIVQVTITRTTAVATLPGFGVPGILAQFATSKTTTAFTRGRYYASLSEMTADGWTAVDSVYLAASKVFGQSPKVPRLFVGRIDSGDASMAAALDAIRSEQDDWYCFTVVGHRAIKFVLSDDTVTGNVIKSTINGTSVADITWATSHAATMAAWKVAIEAALVGSVATVSGREMSVVFVGRDLYAGTFSVTGGATIPTATITYPLDATKTKAIMAWTETQKKLYGFSDSDPATYAVDTGNAGTACLAEYAKLNSYERSFCIYHANGGDFIAAAWMGKELPYDPGARTWALKNLSGVTPDSLTLSQDGYVRGKNANTYTTTAAYSHTYAGTCAKNSTYIDDIRGLDWLESTIKLDQFNLLGGSGKVPFTNPGIELVGNTLKGSLGKAEQKTVLDAGWTVSLPDISQVSAEDKAARQLTGITFSGDLAGAIQKVVIAGSYSA